MPNVLTKYLLPEEATLAAGALAGAKGTYFLDPMTPCIFDALRPGSVLIRESGEAMETIIIKGSLYTLILFRTDKNRGIVERELQHFDLESIGFTPITTKICGIEPEMMTTPHLHRIKTELIIKSHINESVIATFYDRKTNRFFSISLGRSLLKLAGKEYDIGILVPPGICHSIKNANIKTASTIIIISDRLERDAEECELEA